MSYSKLRHIANFQRSNTCGWEMYTRPGKQQKGPLLIEQRWKIIKAALAIVKYHFTRDYVPAGFSAPGMSGIHKIRYSPL